MTTSAKKRDHHHWAMFAAGVAVVVVGVLLWLAAETLLMIFAGILLAAFLGGLTKLVMSYSRLNRGWSLAIVCIVLAGVLGVSGWLTAARLAEQAHQFVEELPRAVGELREQLREYPWGDWLAEELQEVRISAEDREKALSQAAGAASAVLDKVTGAVVIVFLGLFIAVDPDLYKRGLVRLVPVGRRPRAREVIDDLAGALWRFLLGRLLAMAAVGVCATIGFWLIGMPLALILGVFAGLMNFIPNLGPLIWLVPAVLLALMQGATEVVYVLVIFTVVQTAEGYLLTPLVQQRMIHLAPAVMLGTQVLFGVLWGFGGLALATPLAALVVVLVQKLYVEGVLGDRASG